MQLVGAAGRPMMPTFGRLQDSLRNRDVMHTAGTTYRRHNDAAGGGSWEAHDAHIQDLNGTAVMEDRLAHDAGVARVPQGVCRQKLQLRADAAQQIGDAPAPPSEAAFRKLCRQLSNITALCLQRALLYDSQAEVSLTLRVTRLYVCDAA